MLTHVQSMDVLWKLTGLDEQLVRNSQARTRAKAELGKAAARLEDARKVHLAAQAALNKARADQKAAEDELKEHEQRLKRLEAEGTKHAIEALDNERRAVDELETRGLELLEGVQRAEAAELAARQAQKAAEGQLEAAQAVAEGQFKVLDDEERSLREVRGITAAPLDTAVLEVYESANRANPGSALCRAAERLCGGCGGELTMQHVVRVRARSEIVRCPDCARIQDAAAT